MCKQDTLSYGGTSVLGCRLPAALTFPVSTEHFSPRREALLISLPSQHSQSHKNRVIELDPKKETGPDSFCHVCRRPLTDPSIQRQAYLPPVGRPHVEGRIPGF